MYTVAMLTGTRRVERTLREGTTRFRLQKSKAGTRKPRAMGIPFPRCLAPRNPFSWLLDAATRICMRMKVSASELPGFAR